MRRRKRGLERNERRLVLAVCLLASVTMLIAVWVAEIAQKGLNLHPWR